MPTIEVDDEMRRRIKIYYGEPGLATRVEVRRFFVLYGESLYGYLEEETQDQLDLERGQAVCAHRGFVEVDKLQLLSREWNAFLNAYGLPKVDADEED